MSPFIHPNTAPHPYACISPGRLQGSEWGEEHWRRSRLRDVQLSPLHANHEVSHVAVLLEPALTPLPPPLPTLRTNRAGGEFAPFMGRVWMVCATAALILVACNEYLYLAHRLAIVAPWSSSCRWPDGDSGDPLRVLLLADLHLIGRHVHRRSCFGLSCTRVQQTCCQPPFSARLIWVLGVRRGADEEDTGWTAYGGACKHAAPLRYDLLTSNLVNQGPAHAREAKRAATEVSLCWQL